MNVFSYNCIYDNANYLREKVIKRFSLKNKLNPDGIDYEELNISEVLSYLNTEKLFVCNQKQKDTILVLLQKCRNINELTELICFLNKIVNRPYTLPRIFGQVRPTANNNLISKNPDAEYVKIKSNILGVRFTNNNKGKLIIQSPKEKRGAYKMIKREKFSWKIGKVDV